jgi:hypothetical protein
MIEVAPTLSTSRLAALLSGDDILWSATTQTSAELLRTCIDQDLAGLVHARVSACRDGDCPRDVQDDLARRARHHVARELLRRREIASVLDALAAHGVEAILFKGAALAYTVYDAPALRPRCDTDLLIRRDQVDTIRRTMRTLGYVATPLCDGELLFCQFELAKRDQFNVDHAFDFHWKVSTQPAFANVLTYDEARQDARPIPALGQSARGAGPVHALLLACIHPAMHHRNIERLIWTYDVHLLASRFSVTEFDRFVEMAVARKVAAISAHALALAQARFGTVIPGEAAQRLAACKGREPSAVYLRPERRWRHEFMSSVLALPRWRDRLRLLREVVLPSPAYMLTSYGVSQQVPGAALLPVLYIDRLIRGIVKVVAGRK